jgi:hypothetical protein
MYYSTLKSFGLEIVFVVANLPELESLDVTVNLECRTKAESESRDNVATLHQQKRSPVEFLEKDEL